MNKQSSNFLRQTKNCPGKALLIFVVKSSQFDWVQDTVAHDYRNTHFLGGPQRIQITSRFHAETLCLQGAQLGVKKRPHLQTGMSQNGQTQLHRILLLASGVFQALGRGGIPLMPKPPVSILRPSGGCSGTRVCPFNSKEPPDIKSLQSVQGY